MVSLVVLFFQESQKLFPSVRFFSRSTTEDCYLDNFTNFMYFLSLYDPWGLYYPYLWSPLLFLISYVLMVPDGYFVPKGIAVGVRVSIIGLHRNPEVWPGPLSSILIVFYQRTAPQSRTPSIRVCSFLCRTEELHRSTFS